MRRKIHFFALCLIGSILLAGCSFSPELNLTEEEQQQIVHYSASLLLKYSDGYKKTLVDTSAERELQAKVAAIREQKAQIQENKETDKKAKGEKQTESPYAPSGEQNIAAALLQDGIEISYSGYEVCASYPEESAIEESFALDSTEGKELLVFHFQVSNPSEEEKECNILSKDPVFRIIINGEERKNALHTLLLNDLANLNEVRPAGGTVDAVVVIEVPEGYAESIESLSILMKTRENQSIIPIE